MSLGAIRKVALAVFKESVRDRVPYSLVLVAVVLMAKIASADLSLSPSSA